MKTLHFASSNAGKQREISAILAPALVKYNFRLESVDVPGYEIQGSGEEIIRDKLRQAFDKIQDATIVEDSALCFHAWNDLPGVYIKPVRDAVGSVGLFNMLKSFDDKSGRGECRIGIAVKGKEPVFFTGKVEGTIVFPRGEGGFGWDKLFLPNGYDQTYAEMPQDLKDQVSDRSSALRQFIEFLEASPEWLS